MIIYGGWVHGGASNQCYGLNLSTLKWTKLESPQLTVGGTDQETRRYGHSAHLINNNKTMLVYGGKNQFWHNLQSCLLLQVSTSQSTSTRSTHSLLARLDEKFAQPVTELVVDEVPLVSLQQQQQSVSSPTTPKNKLTSPRSVATSPNQSSAFSPKYSTAPQLPINEDVEKKVEQEKPKKQEDERIKKQQEDAKRIQQELEEKRQQQLNKQQEEMDKLNKLREEQDRIRQQELLNKQKQEEQDRLNKEEQDRIKQQELLNKQEEQERLNKQKEEQERLSKQKEEQDRQNELREEQERITQQELLNKQQEQDRLNKQKEQEERDRSIKQEQEETKSQDVNQQIESQEPIEQDEQEEQITSEPVSVALDSDIQDRVKAVENKEKLVNEKRPMIRRSTRKPKASTFKPEMVEQAEKEAIVSLPNDDHFSKLEQESSSIKEEQAAPAPNKPKGGVNPFGGINMAEMLAQRNKLKK
ncbi:hypothetical protein AKO1_006293 [Acrasis kona]|uniref:Uncharacterized protein n=1 Tax=Acrasis kona TaxID=1008807 RepID=A0AAW2YK35_9EUKA